MPLSLLGTFGVMSFAGMSLDNLSLMALTVATGFVVDDAIVMIENIVRYIEQGKSGKEAAEIGAKEIGFTVLSLTVSLVAVFLPLLLMPGVTGRLFHEFAWVLTIAVTISMLVSLTLTPMMCAYLLKPDQLPPGDDAHERQAAAGKRDLWTRTVDLYANTLDWVLDHRQLTMLVAAAAVVLTVFLYIVIPKGLLPEQDTGLITGVVQADDNIAFPQMEDRTKAVAEALRKDPAVAGVAAFIGAGTINPTLNQGQLSIVLKDRGDRDGLDALLPRLQQAVANIPGVALYLKPVQDVTLDSRVAATEYQYSLSDVNSAELAKYAAQMTQAMRQRPELADVDNNLANNGNALKLDIDREKASRLGVPVQSIDDTLYDAFGQRQISTIFTQLNQYRVVLEVAPEFRNSDDLLNKLTVRGNGNGALTGSNATSFGQLKSSNSATPSGIGNAGNVGFQLGGGGTIPLSSLVSAKVTSAPLVVSHQQQLPAVTLAFNVAPGYSLSDAVSAIHEVEAQTEVPAAGARRVRRQGRRVRLLAGRRSAAAAGRDRGDLHRAGRAVRELHPSADDHLHPAAGRRRCAAGADPVRHEPVGGRHRRHRAADRHRQEERDHDDRLRDRGAAHRTECARCDPPRVPAALPPDHDDHRRGDARCVAARAGQRHRRRTAPAARRVDRRRPAAVAAGHAVHHAGDLPVHGAFLRLAGRAS